MLALIREMLTVQLPNEIKEAAEDLRHEFVGLR